MRRVFLSFGTMCLLLLAIAGSSVAAVHVRIAVSPSIIPQCSEGHGILLIANDGTSPILARVCFALSRNDTTILGPLCGRVPLAAGERRTHEFTFFIPPRTRPADYAFGVRAQGSDGSSDQAMAPFTVTQATSPCVPPVASAADPNADMLNGVMQGANLSTDQPASILPTTWGRIKLIYR